MFQETDDNLFQADEAESNDGFFGIGLSDGGCFNDNEGRTKNKHGNDGSSQRNKSDVPTSDDEEEQLPAGWIKVASRTRPGRYVYQNELTNERSSTRPKFPATNGPFIVTVHIEGSTLQQQSLEWLAAASLARYQRSEAPRGRLRQRESPMCTEAKQTCSFANRSDKTMRQVWNPKDLNVYTVPSSEWPTVKLDLKSKISVALKSGQHVNIY